MLFLSIIRLAHYIPPDLNLYEVNDLLFKLDARVSDDSSSEVMMRVSQNGPPSYTQSISY